MSSELNIPNLNKLIAHLERIRAEDFRLDLFAEGEVTPHSCGTAACIAGWSLALRDGSYDCVSFNGWTNYEAANWLGIPTELNQQWDLFAPPGYENRGKYPLPRAIATLKRLRDHYLATGEVVVDWGPEPTEGQPWSAPRAIELAQPDLPEELTRFLAPKSDTVSA